MGIFDFKNKGSGRPAINLPEILALSEVIHKCSDLRTLMHVYDKKGDYPNPQISLDFAFEFYSKGDKATAKQAWVKGASFGLKYPCPYYDTPFIDAVGQCFMLLLTQFPTVYLNPKVKSATSLGYIYLSRCIELCNKQTFDSYRSRALLIKNHTSAIVWQGIIMENLGMGALVDPLIISDFYFASQVPGNPHQDALQSAKRIHQKLEDISIGGKDADEYSLQEMAEVGEIRHNILFKGLEKKYQAGEFNLNIDDLMNLNR